MNIIDIMNIQFHFKVRGNQRNLYPTTMPFWSLIKGIQENPKLAELTEQGRALPKDEYNKWKPKNLTSIYFAPKFKDHTGKPDLKNLNGYTGLAGFDFDHVDPEVTIETLKSIPSIVCAGVSASGKGVWAVGHVAASTATEYKACFADAIGKFKELKMTGIDVGCHDPTRARFVASDPNCWWRNDNVDEIPPFMPVGDLTLLGNQNKKRKRKKKMPKNYKPSPELAFDQVRTAMQEVEAAPDGEVNTTMARVCGELKGIAHRAGVPVTNYVSEFIKRCDDAGCDHKRTVSMATRLLINTEKEG